MIAKTGKSGFTLLELVIIIIIIGVLAAILLPALAKTRETARRGACFSNLQQIGLAIHLYSLEHEGELPWSGGANDARCFANLHPEYIGDWRIYMCPSDPQWDQKIPLSNTEQQRPYSYRQSYEYFGAWTTEPIKVDLNDPVVRNPDIPIVWDSFSASRIKITLASHVPAGGNFIFIDGHMEFARRREWYAPNLPVFPPNIDFDLKLSEDVPKEWLYPEDDY